MKFINFLFLLVIVSLVLSTLVLGAMKTDGTADLGKLEISWWLVFSPLLLAFWTLLCALWGWASNN